MASGAFQRNLVLEGKRDSSISTEFPVSVPCCSVAEALNSPFLPKRPSSFSSTWYFGTELVQDQANVATGSQPCPCSFFLGTKSKQAFALLLGPLFSPSNSTPSLPPSLLSLLPLPCRTPFSGFQPSTAVAWRLRFHLSFSVLSNSYD